MRQQTEKAASSALNGQQESTGRKMADDERIAVSIGAPPVVEVLLATYNGGRFLREQIDSILSQDYKNLRILARDDGSSDNTTTILNEYERGFPNRFRVIPTDAPTGSAKNNFLKLMTASSAGYVCFSDQDDVWVSNKISRSMQAMARLEAHRGAAVPLLVFTDLRVVDDQLKTLHESFWTQAGIDPSRLRKLATVLVQNPVTGCTTLINRPLLNLALHMPEEATMHDAWIGLLASACGSFEALRERTVLYRQHDRNVVGVEARRRSPRELLAVFLSRRPRVLQWKSNERVVEALLRVHGQELSIENRKLLMAYLRCGRHDNRAARLAMMVRYSFFRKGLLRNLITFIDLWRGKMSC